MFVAVNDNLTADEFHAGKVPSPTGAMLGTDMRILVEARAPDGAWFLMKRFWHRDRGYAMPAAVGIAAQPHPLCPPWDGKTPAMSGIPTAPKNTEVKPRPSFLRVV